MATSSKSRTCSGWCRTREVTVKTSALELLVQLAGGDFVLAWNAAQQLDSEQGRFQCVGAFVHLGVRFQRKAVRRRRPRFSALIQVVSGLRISSGTSAAGAFGGRGKFDSQYVESGVDAIATKLPIFRHYRLQFEWPIEFFGVCFFNDDDAQVRFDPFGDCIFWNAMRE